MRKLIVAALSAALMTTSALAADKGAPVDLLPPMPAVASNTSCYIQALAGSSISTATVKAEDVLPASVSAAGWTVGAGIGCDMKIERIVIGALARIELPVDTDGTIGGVDFDKSWMVGARLGYLLGPGVLAYGLVGYETSELSLAAIDVDKDGIVLGAGLEVFLTKHLSLNAEYTNTIMNDIGGAGFKIEPESHKARVGLTFRFQSLFGE
jgi:opacity protein-like surface antigen